MDPKTFNPKHFLWNFEKNVATITLNRPERKNPLTFESYAELRDTFRALTSQSSVRAIIMRGAGGNFCSGGDVHEIIGPLTKMSMPELLQFTRMTGDLILAMRECPQPIVAAIEGICVGAGAAIAMACDLRVASDDASVAFLFVRVGLAGCDMGACAMLPRIIGAGRAADLLYSGRKMLADEALSFGFYNRVVAKNDLLKTAGELADELANGPSFAHAMTKKMLNQECSMSLREALEAEAQAQAICMQSKDFGRAYAAFVDKKTVRFEGD